MSKERLDGKGRGASTQSLEEKLAAPPMETGEPGFARQKLGSLKTRWGLKTPDDWRKCELLMCRGMDYTEIWARVSGVGDDAVFELREKRK